jgi:hypothetical protein
VIETLFLLVFGEVVVGGGGRTFAVGALSLRMLLFAAGLLATSVGLLSSGRSRDGVPTAALLVLAFFASMLPGLLVDAARGTPSDIVFKEIQPLLFWLSAPFFAFAFQDARTINRAGSLIVYGGVTVAFVTSLLMVGLWMGVVNFGALYLWADDTGELIFRGSTNFFYKGHFFVGIALVFVVVLTPRWWKSMAFVLALSLGLSLTRGLYLAVAVALILSFVSGRRQVAIMIIAVVAILLLGLYSQAILDLLFDPSRARSAETRSRDLSFFVATFDYRTLLLGDGTGALLNGRANIENSFLWAIWRFGVTGLAFMFLPLMMAARYFAQIPFDSDVRKPASAFFFGIVMLYIVTAFNPFVNNSIGLTYLLCALFALRRMREMAREAAALLELKA